MGFVACAHPACSMVVCCVFFYRFVDVFPWQHYVTVSVILMSRLLLDLSRNLIFSFLFDLICPALESQFIIFHSTLWRWQSLKLSTPSSINTFIQELWRCVFSHCDPNKRIIMIAILCNIRELTIMLEFL
jgi:hypothetical protein